MGSCFSIIDYEEEYFNCKNCLILNELNLVCEIQHAKIELLENEIRIYKKYELN